MLEKLEFVGTEFCVPHGCFALIITTGCVRGTGDPSTHPYVVWQVEAAKPAVTSYCNESVVGRDNLCTLTVQTIMNTVVQKHCKCVSEASIFPYNAAMGPQEAAESAAAGRDPDMLSRIQGAVGAASPLGMAVGQLKDRLLAGAKGYAS